MVIDVVGRNRTVYSVTGPAPVPQTPLTRTVVIIYVTELEASIDSRDLRCWM